MKGLSQHARYAGAGLQFAVTFLLTGWLGWWLDGKFGTSPWLLLVGIFLGAGGGFYSLVLKVGSPGQGPRDDHPTTPPPPT